MKTCRFCPSLSAPARETRSFSREYDSFFRINCSHARTETYGHRLDFRTRETYRNALTALTFDDVGRREYLATTPCLIFFATSSSAALSRVHRVPLSMTPVTAYSRPGYKCGNLRQINSVSIRIRVLLICRIQGEGACEFQRAEVFLRNLKLTITAIRRKCPLKVSLPDRRCVG